jgi:pimeloyl-ACP methyl ester carboxylesterase
MSFLLLIVMASLIGGGSWLWTPDKPLAELEKTYLKSPGDYLEVNGVRLHVRDSGPKSAPAVILLHGFSSSLHTWEDWSNVLDTELRVIRFDLPGSGLSGPDPNGVYSDESGVVVLGALMDKLGLARASLVGNSMGGKLAWKFAAQFPARVDKLVLVSPDGFASPGFEYGKPPKVPAMLRLMRYSLPKPLLRMSLAPAFADPALMREDLVTRYHDMMLAPGNRDAILARMEQILLTDPVPQLKLIKAPTLLIWGEKDAMIPFSNSADYLKGIAGSRLESFPTLGHVPQEENPSLSVAPVKRFLAP